MRFPGKRYSSLAVGCGRVSANAAVARFKRGLGWEYGLDMAIYATFR